MQGGWPLAPENRLQSSPENPGTCRTHQRGSVQCIQSSNYSHDLGRQTFYFLPPSYLVRSLIAPTQPVKKKGRKSIKSNEDCFKRVACVKAEIKIRLQNKAVSHGILITKQAEVSLFHHGMKGKDVVGSQTASTDRTVSRLWIVETV